MHGDIKFGEKFVTGLTGKYVLDSRDGVDFALNLMALLRAQELDTQRIVLSFLGMIKVPLIQEERPAGERTPTWTSRSSLVMNFGS